MSEQRDKLVSALARAIDAGVEYLEAELLGDAFVLKAETPPHAELEARTVSNPPSKEWFGSAEDEPDTDETPHARALRELDLKPGDRVKVERKVESCTDGWDQSWVDDGDVVEGYRSMDDAIGKEGPVVSIAGAEGVSVELPGFADDYFFPAHALTVVSRAGEEEREEPDKPQTLAEVKPFTLCEIANQYGESMRQLGWHDGMDVIVFGSDEHHAEPFVWVGRRPDEVNVLKEIGPIRVITTTELTKLKDQLTAANTKAEALEKRLREVEGERDRLKRRALKAEYENYELADLRDGINATRDEDGEWMLPYYHGDGSHTMMLLDDWLEARRLAAKHLADQQQSDVKESRTVKDGFGNEWAKCDRPDCGLHVVRPGKTQCDCDAEQSEVER